MVRFSLFALFALVLSGQDASELFHKPPADVDKALRERVNEFFELHVKGDFRHAEALVAEDTKDFFYNNNKPRYLSFQILKIVYNDDFTRAQVTVMCEQYVNFPGMQSTPMKVPTPSTWKLENGKWCWYVDQEQFRNTPFGRLTPGPPSPNGKLFTPGAVPTAQQFYEQFKADKSSVTLQPGGSEQVSFSNGSPGPMKLQVIGAVAGIETKFDQTEVKAGERAVLTVHAGEAAKSGTLQVRIDPIGKMIPIQISVK